jgi:hypothetical protein
MEESVKVGQLLRAARLAAGLTQGQVADKLHIKFQHLSGYERNWLRIPEKRLADLVKVLPTLKNEQLQEAWALASDPVIRDDLAAARQSERLIAGRRGTLVVFGGSKVGMAPPALLGSWRKFLRREGNQIIFIVPPLNESAVFRAQGVPESQTPNGEVLSLPRAAGQRKDLTCVLEIQGKLVGKNVGAKRRVEFYAPIFPSNGYQNKGVRARLQDLNRLLHPLTTTILFEPEDNSLPRSGLIRTQVGLNKPSKGKYIWIRASSDFLGRLSSLLRVTLWAHDRDKLMTPLPLPQGGNDCLGLAPIPPDWDAPMSI